MVFTPFTDNRGTADFRGWKPASAFQGAAPLNRPGTGDGALSAAGMATLALACAAALYQMALAWLNANVAPVPDSLIAATDGAVVLAALGLALCLRPAIAAMAIAAITLNFALLAALSGTFSPKSIRDLLVPAAFLILGLATAGTKAPQRAFVVIGVLVVAVGLIEWLFRAPFLSAFDPQSYFFTRGGVRLESIEHLPEHTLGNGQRWGDRYMLPFLGPQRLGSIFLEPVSLANFGVLAMVVAGVNWIRRNPRMAIFAFAVGAFAIIGSDSRFGLLAGAAVLALAIAPAFVQRLLPVVLPGLFVAGLIVVAALHTGAFDDDFGGRTALSGSLLASMSLPEVLGLSAERSFVDAGYYYVFASYGIVFCALAWIGFCAIPAQSQAALYAKAAIGLLACALLCVSGTSLFALKFSALVWLLLGAYVGARASAPFHATAPSPFPSSLRSPHLLAPVAAFSPPPPRTPLQPASRFRALGMATARTSGPARTFYSVPGSIGSLSIVHVVRQFHPAVGGLESVVLNLARQQAEAGHSVRVVTLNTVFSDPSAVLPDREMLDGIEIVRVPWFGSKRYPVALSVNRAIGKPDIVHVHAIDFFVDWIALTRRWRKGAPVVVSTHGGFFHSRFASRLKEVFFATVTRFSLSRCAAIIAISQPDHDRFRKIAPANTVLLENGVDVMKFSGAASASPQKCAITWSRWSTNKRIDRLLAAFAALHAADPEWRLILAGSPGDLSEADMRGPIDTLRLTGAVDLMVRPSDAELRGAIGRASVFVSASEYEGFGVSTVEAMSAGLVPAISAIPAHQAILRAAPHGTTTGFRTPARAAEAIAAAWQDLQANPQRTRQDLMDASQNWAWSRVAERTNEIYGRVLGRTTRRLVRLDITVATQAEAVRLIDAAEARPQPMRIAFANAHTIRLAMNDETYAEALNTFCIFNDGVGVDWASRRLFAQDFPDNLNGTDFVPHYFLNSAVNHRVFLFGARRGVAERAAAALESQWGGRHTIAGVHHGEVPERDWASIAGLIRETGATFVLVAMGNPKQELWLARHLDAAGCAAGMGVGALFDFLSGRVERAPEWMRAVRLEWAFRILKEPGRLWERYLVGGLVFAGGVSRQKSRRRLI